VKYNVHLYAVVRVKVNDVEAESQTEAIDKAGSMVNFNSLLDASRPSRVVEYVEYADEVNTALVDEQGDEDYERSKFYKIGEKGEWVEG
jgi:hypothetical protein